MTGFELVSLAVAVTALLVATVGIPGFILMWATASDEQKAEFWRLVAKLRQKAYRWWVYISCAVLVGTGVGKVTEFVTSSEPMTRVDVFLLLMNLMSLTVFSVTSLLVIVLFQLEDRKKPTAANL